MIRLSILLSIGCALGSCITSPDEDLFLEESFRAQQREKENELVNFTVIREESVEPEVTKVIYSATVNRNGQRHQVRDSLLYSLTGDGVPVSYY